MTGSGPRGGPTAPAPRAGTTRAVPRIRSRRPTLPLALVLAVACGTGETAPELRVDVAVSPTPPAVPASRVLVSVTTPGGAPVERAIVEVRARPEQEAGDEPRMAGASYRASEVAPGRYAVPALPLPSPGPWLLEVRVRTDDGRTGGRTQRVGVAGGGPGRGET